MEMEAADQNIENARDGLKDLEDEIKLKQADLSKSLKKKTKITKNLKKLRQSLNRKKLKAEGLRKELESLKSGIEGHDTDSMHFLDFIHF